MPEGPIDYGTLAMMAQDDGTQFHEVTLAPGQFVEGANVLAVEIHQASPNNNDISFDLALVGVPIIVFNQLPQVAFTQPGPDPVYASPASFTLEASDRPRTTPVIRWQARRGMKATNLRHERVELDVISAVLLPMLDGKHDRSVLLASLVTLHEKGRLRLPDKLLEAAGAEEILGKQLDQALRFMARAALLES